MKLYTLEFYVIAVRISAVKSVEWVVCPSVRHLRMMINEWMIDPGNALLPEGLKPSPELMLTYCKFLMRSGIIHLKHFHMKFLKYINH